MEGSECPPQVAAWSGKPDDELVPTLLCCGLLRSWPLSSLSLHLERPLLSCKMYLTRLRFLCLPTVLQSIMPLNTVVSPVNSSGFTASNGTMVICAPESMVNGIAMPDISAMTSFSFKALTLCTYGDLNLSDSTLLFLWAIGRLVAHLVARKANNRLFVYRRFWCRC